MAVLMKPTTSNAPLNIMTVKNITITQIVSIITCDEKIAFKSVDSFVTTSLVSSARRVRLSLVTFACCSIDDAIVTTKSDKVAKFLSTSENDVTGGSL